MLLVAFVNCYNNTSFCTCSALRDAWRVTQRATQCSAWGSTLNFSQWLSAGTHITTDKKLDICFLLQRDSREESDHVIDSYRLNEVASLHRATWLYGVVQLPVKINDMYMYIMRLEFRRRVSICRLLIWNASFIAILRLQLSSAMSEVCVMFFGASSEINPRYFTTGEHLRWL